MADKNIFVYKYLLPLNISDFSLFFMYKLHPPPTHPHKNHPLFLSTAPLKGKILFSPQLFENLVGDSIIMNFI